MKRTYVVADLHGRCDLLGNALAAMEHHAGDGGGTFVCLGDFVDRGPEPRSCIDVLMAGPTLPGWRWIALKGNHEDMMTRCCRGEAPFRWWLGNGGVSTCKSYGYSSGENLHPYREPLGAHLDWLESLPLTYLDEHRVYVHAGLDHDLPLSAQSDELMLWKLYGRHEEDEFWGRHVVHGHHQFANGPILNRGRTDLDTFAWSTGRLAIGVFEDDRAGGPVEILWSTDGSSSSAHGPRHPPTA